MHEPEDHLQTLTDIRSLMERSAKFLSLSGLSGVSAGLIALIGVGLAYFHPTIRRDEYNQLGTYRQAIIEFLLVDALFVLGFALAAGTFFTVRKARRQGATIWNPASRRLLWALAVPLMAGGVFCAGLIYHELFWLAFPSTLIFYGLALLNGSRYTVRDVEYLGVSEVVLGLISVFLTGYALQTWAIGFGVLNIVYGVVMWVKYERPAA